MATAIRSIQTKFGPATLSSMDTGQTKIHTIANWMWLPMLAMGGMAVLVALGLGIAQANAASDLGERFSAERKADFETLKPLTSGVLFLGEAFILAGVSFLLATILGALRKGGGEVQRASGGLVKTLKMPVSAWAFMGLMMMGVMAQFVAFGSLIYVATQAHDAWASATGADLPGNVSAFNRSVTWAAWANPLRQVSLGLLLGGIGLALYTISNVLGFQFGRIRELIVGQDEGGN